MLRHKTQKIQCNMENVNVGLHRNLPTNAYSSVSSDCSSLEATEMVVGDGKDAGSAVRLGSTGFTTHRKKLSCEQTWRTLKCTLPCERSWQTGWFQQCGLVKRQGWTDEWLPRRGRRVVKTWDRAVWSCDSVHGTLQMQQSPQCPHRITH